MYYTYVLKSKVDGNLYIGFCNNLKRRFKDHNTGKVISTRSRKPFNLIYYEACLLKERALKREKYFKSGFGRRYLKTMV